MKNSRNHGVRLSFDAGNCYRIHGAHLVSDAQTGAVPCKYNAVLNMSDARANTKT